MRKLIPLVAALGVLLFFMGPGRAYLPAGLQLRSTSAIVTNEQPADHQHGSDAKSALGLAPSPVVNPIASAARITAKTQPAEKTERGYVLEATVRAPSGDALADANVKFYELVDILGTREMLIGTGVTDGRGVASIAYLPAQTGTHQIVVRTSQAGKVSAGEARLTFEASVAVPTPKTERPSLAQFSDRVPYVVGALVVAVWALIGFALFGTARGVFSGARGT